MLRTRILQFVGLAALAGILAWSLSLVGGDGQKSPEPATAGKASPTVSATISETLAAIDASASSNPAMASSNPFVIANGTPQLDNIIALGTPGIAGATDYIDGSSQNGLNEYLLAICVQRISRASLSNAPGQVSYWDNGKDFTRAWKAHLAKVPGEVAAIAKSQDTPDAKNTALVALGTPAIPFILDEVAKGRGDFSHAAEELMDGTVELNGHSARGLATAAWARQNGGRFSALRSMVVAAQNTNAQ